MKNKYSSFEEIDRRLQILKLKRKIDMEYIKLDTQSIKKYFYRPKLAHKAEIVIQKLALTFVLKKLVAWRSKQKRKKLELQS